MVHQGGDQCNVGHAIEFVGFALEHLPPQADDANLVATSIRILVALHSERVLAGPGIRLSVSAETGKKPTSPYCPWWSLPETIRAAALAHERTLSEEALVVWQKAHRAFFGFLLANVTPPIAYQTLTAKGPVDDVPATPDLDPGYHTGLSLLGAVEVIDRLSRGVARRTRGRRPKH